MSQNSIGENGTPAAVPCECGSGAVRLTWPDGRMLTLGDVELFLSGAIGGLLSGSIDTALRRLDGQPRAQARAKRRTEALTRRVMRDRAIRILAKRGLSVRAIAADLHTGRGTVARALGAGAIGRTRAYEARLRALGYQLRRMTMDDLRRILAGERDTKRKLRRLRRDWADTPSTGGARREAGRDRGGDG